jgi:hypothetical protein
MESAQWYGLVAKSYHLFRYSICSVYQSKNMCRNPITFLDYTKLRFSFEKKKGMLSIG